MQVIRTKKFIKLLQNILDYIAKDKLSAAIKFKKEMDEQIFNKNTPVNHEA